VNLGQSAGQLLAWPRPISSRRKTSRPLRKSLRVLTRESWDSDDLTLFDACWRQAANSDLFAGEFNADRLCIQHCVEVSRKQLRITDRTFL